MKRNYKKGMAVTQVLIIILASFAIISLSSENVQAANVCCEKTKSGDFCQQTDDANCDPAFKNAATSCAQTSFCRPTCCFNPKDSSGEETGLCYSNYPKTTCDNYQGQADISDASCLSSVQCQEGCCIIGTQAQYITQQRCILETAKFPDLQVDFRSGVKSEQDCLNIVRSAEKGCCVTDEDNAVYTTRASCSAEQTSKTGFFKGKYCSELDFVKCAPADPKLKGDGNPKNTGCLPDEEDVYWIDSCGNPEGVKEDCDYVKGNLCGDSDGDGKFTCEDLNCDPSKMGFSLKDYYGTDKTDIEKNAQGRIMQGQSWCMYDSNQQDKKYGGRDPVGSRFYRSLCVNGKEIVEPCQDFRKEWCIDGQAEVKDDDGRKYEFNEGRCRENRWQSCVDDCNSLQNVDASDEGEVEQAFKDDIECCLNTDKRDCRWIGPGGSKEVMPFGTGTFGPYCIPQVTPGTKFWEDEGSNNCGKGSLECEVKFQCPGVRKLFGWITGDKCAGGLISGQSWKIIAGEGCLSQEWVQYANDVCRSFGDCGADVNIDGKLSLKGFSNTPTISNDFKPYKGPGFLESVSEARTGGNWGDWGEQSKNKIQRFFGRSGTQLIISGVIGTFSMIAAKGWLFSEATAKGLFGVTKGLGLREAFFGPVPKLGAGTDVLWKAGEAGVEAAYTPITTTTGLAKGSVVTLGESYYGLQSGVSYEVVGIEARVGVGNVYTITGEGVTRTVTSTELAAAGGQLQTTAGKEAVKGAAQGAFQWLNALMWAWTAYNLINIFMEGTETVKISTQCKTWVAPTPTKGTCERCNPDNTKEKYVDSEGKPLSAKALKECSEYRCKSFGQACSLVNEGTENQTCVSLEPFDVTAPIIDVWYDGTKLDKKCITNKGKGIGFEIKNTKGCLIPAYERVNIGISTDEPAQCKMSFKNNIQFDQMDPFYFGSQQYLYFHQQVLTYPQTANVTQEGLQLGQAPNTYKLYVRCEDALANDNERDYVITFTVDKGPDLSAPSIEFTSIPQETYLAAGQNGTDVILYINEPAECRWSQYDLDYDSMSLDNTCKTRLSTSNDGLYSCVYKEGYNSAAGEGPPISGTSAVNQLYYFYFKCKDQPICVNNKDPSGADCTRNTNKDSYQLKLRTSENLTITSVLPETGTDIFIGAAGANVSLEVETESGALRNGNAFCGFTTSQGEGRNILAMTPFFNTNDSSHSQILTPSTGKQTYYIGCTDVAGNLVFNQTTFNVKIDQQAPLIIRAFEDTSTSPSTFKIETDEQASCQYRNDKTFAFGDGNLMQPGENNQHIASSGFTIYYVICQDVYGNTGDVAKISLLK